MSYPFFKRCDCGWFIKRVHHKFNIMVWFCHYDKKVGNHISCHCFFIFWNIFFNCKYFLRLNKPDWLRDAVCLFLFLSWKLSRHCKIANSQNSKVAELHVFAFIWFSKTKSKEITAVRVRLLEFRQFEKLFSFKDQFKQKNMCSVGVQFLIYQLNFFLWIALKIDRFV